MKKFKKVLSALTAISIAFSGMGAVFANGTENKFEILANIDYDSVRRNDTPWDFSQALEGDRKWETNDGFSGNVSLKLVSNGAGYTGVEFFTGWNYSGAVQTKVNLTEGKTYILSWKTKKIDPAVTFSGFRTDSYVFTSSDGKNESTKDWIYGYDAKPADRGWKTASFKFKAGEAIGGVSTKKILNKLPDIMYHGGNSKDVLLIDDFRISEINDVSVLEGTDPTASVSGMNSKSVEVTFSQEMNEKDVSNPKAYMINGVEAKSVIYNKTSKTATVTPANEFAIGEKVEITVSAADYLGRAVNTTQTRSIAYDGTYNVDGFAYGEYDDALYRDGGYDGGYDPEYDYTKDEQEVKYLIDENFVCAGTTEQQGESVKAPSGWDARTLGGGLKNQYFYYQALCDVSDKFPVELSRSFERANHGKLTLEFIYVPIIKEQSGATFNLYSGNDKAVTFEEKSDGLYLKSKNGDIFLGASKVRNAAGPVVNSWQGDAGYNNGVRAEINLDTNKIEKVFFKGKEVAAARDIDFLNEVEYIDCFNVNTGDENVGELWMRGVQLYRGYVLNDRFATAGTNVPTDYNANDSVSMMRQDSGTPWDNANMVLKQGASAYKNFDKIENDKMVFEYHIYQPEKSNGFELSLNNGTTEVIKYSVKDNKFYYNTEDGDKELYSDYFAGVWYKLRAYLDLKTKTATLYVNGIKKVENVALSSNTIDTLKVSNSDAKDVYADWFRLWYDTEEAADYCPEPQPVKPKDGIELGMQFCPMWRNGFHTGWDTINTDKRRVPYLGYYDEGNPEVNDWIIKDLLEHGFTFQRITVIADTNGPYCNPNFGGQFIDEGLKYAKYADMLPYCVLLETGSVYTPTKEYFMNHYLPYLIEHYFKDPRYFKIDGRPVLSVWNTANLFKYAGTREDANLALEDKKELCKQFIADIRKACMDAGVGNPLITGNVSANESALKLYKELGLDASMPYGSANTLEGQKAEIDKSLRYTGNEECLDKTITFSPGLDGSVWNTTGTQVIESEDYRTLLDYYLSKRDSFASDSLARRVVCFDTFDEYGEGHWIAPTGGEGFGYYDEIYEAFTGNDESDHTHVVPTTAQKDRFNNCYPANRRMKTIEVPQSVPSHEVEGSTVKKAWNFNTNGDTEGWYTMQYIDGLTAQDGALTGKVTGADSIIHIRNLDIDYRGVIQLKVRIKYDTAKTVTQNQLFYICAEEGHDSWTQAQSFQLSGEWNKDSGYVDLIYVLAGTNFSSNLTGLRFDPINGMPPDEGGTTFSIDKIELIYNSDYDNTAKDEEKFNSSPAYFVNGENVETIDYAPSVKNGENYYPLRELAVKLGGKVDYDRLNDRTTVYTAVTDSSQGFEYVDLNKYIQIDGKTQTTTLGEGLSSAAAEPMLFEDNHIVYASEKLFRQMFNKQLSFDKSTRYITAAEVSGYISTLQVNAENKTASISVENYTDSSFGGHLIAAIYDKGVLKAVKIGDYQTAVSGGALSFKGMDVSNVDFDSSDLEVKYFVFESMDNLKAVTSPFDSIIISK